MFKLRLKMFEAYLVYNNDAQEALNYGDCYRVDNPVTDKTCAYAVCGNKNYKFHLTVSFELNKTYAVGPTEASHCSIHVLKNTL